MGRKLVIQEFITLDGVMQAPGTKDEDTRGGFTHGGWQIPYYDEAIIGIMMERYAASDALLFGQRTYEAFAAYWPTAPADDPFAGEMNRLKKYVVAADDIDTVAWQNSERITGDVVAEIAKLKAEDGKDITVIGSGLLAQTLMQNNLVDEYIIFLAPLKLGTGTKLFNGDSVEQSLELLGSKVATTGELVLHYKVKE